MDMHSIVQIAKKAGAKIMSIYALPFDVEIKSDNSPLTQADQAANQIIVDFLAKEYPDIPIISEETKLTEYGTRKDWNRCWLVDPLDGTKEFIKKNGEFTVNIALIENGRPVEGVVYIPAQRITYFTQDGKAYKEDAEGSVKQIMTKQPDKHKIVVMGSRSHSSPAVEAFVDQLKTRYDEVEFQAAGSSLKFCYIAEGKAHCYPRLGPTMEWDTGAGQAVVEKAGGAVRIHDTQEPLTYNKPDLLNPFFVVEA